MELQPFSKAEQDDVSEKQFLERLKQSRNLISNMKTLFAQMTVGNVKYADPTEVLRAVSDQEGRPLELGDQQDIGEFNGQFLQRIQDGLNYMEIYEEYIKKRKQEEEKKLKQMQSS